MALVHVTTDCAWLVLQLEPQWPRTHWDHWVRNHTALRGRDVVIPEVRVPDSDVPPSSTTASRVAPHGISAAPRDCSAPTCTDAPGLPHRRQGHVHEPEDPQPVLRKDLAQSGPGRGLELTSRFEFFVDQGC